MLTLSSLIKAFTASYRDAATVTAGGAVTVMVDESEVPVTAGGTASVSVLTAGGLRVGAVTVITSAGA